VKDEWISKDASMTYAYSEWDGEMPVASNYMPEWPEEQKTMLMMYETCTEGTPISPPFATAEELAHWLAENNASAFGKSTATYDEWLATIKRGWAVSAVLSSAHGMESGVAALARDDKKE